MTLGWPAALVLTAIILGGVSLYATVLASRGSVATEEAKGKYGEQYRMIADDYEKLAQETRQTQAEIRAEVSALAKEVRGAQSTIATDVTRLADAVESMEKMMRDVG